MAALICTLCGKRIPKHQSYYLDQVVVEEGCADAPVCVECHESRVPA